MNQLPQQAMPLGLDSILSDLDDADIEETEYKEFEEFFSMRLPGLNVPAAHGGLCVRQSRRKVWLFNAAWIALCLVIFTGALLFALRMLAQ